MGNLFLIGLVVLFGCAFWQQRRQTEIAQRFIEQRCQHLGLQLLNVARGEHVFKDDEGRIGWRTRYYFEFSADGQDNYQGHILMKRLHPFRFHVPPHRMPETLVEN